MQPIDVSGGSCKTCRTNVRENKTGNWFCEDCKKWVNRWADGLLIKRSPIPEPVKCTHDGACPTFKLMVVATRGREKSGPVKNFSPHCPDCARQPSFSPSFSQERCPDCIPEGYVYPYKVHWDKYK